MTWCDKVIRSVVESRWRGQTSSGRRMVPPSLRETAAPQGVVSRAMVSSGPARQRALVISSAPSRNDAPDYPCHAVGTVAHHVEHPEGATARGDCQRSVASTTL